jgi:magnesium-transporting ATPase (P-type)
MKIFLRKLKPVSALWINGLIFFLVFAIMTNVAIAEDIVIDNPLGSGGKDIPTLIGTIANWLLGIGITISTIIVLWAAFLFMTSGGSEKRVTQARQTLWYAIIGLSVLLLASGVSIFIQNVLSGNFG